VSRTSRAIGPSTASRANPASGGPPPARPGLGRNPTTEQKLAGVRSEPARSVPWQSQNCPVASTAAEPPDEPPGIACGVPGVAGHAEDGIECVGAGAKLGCVLFGDYIPNYKSNYIIDKHLTRIIPRPVCLNCPQTPCREVKTPWDRRGVTEEGGHSSFRRPLHAYQSDRGQKLMVTPALNLSRSLTLANPACTVAFPPRSWVTPTPKPSILTLPISDCA